MKKTEMVVYLAHISAIIRLNTYKMDSKSIILLLKWLIVKKVLYILSRDTELSLSFIEVT